MVKAENLIKNYPDFSLRVSFELEAGRITGLIGKNGAGKSTLIKLVLGLIRADGGMLSVLGSAGCELPVSQKQRIGAVLSDSGFSGYLTAKDAARIQKAMYENFSAERFLELCGSCGLPANKPIREYSTGMKAKLRVLTALSHDAKLLVLDEPTAGMDVQARNEILDMIREYLLDHEDCAVLITSHIASDLEGLCDDIYLIDHGRMLLHEDTDVILSGYAILKMDETKRETLDMRYILTEKCERYGFCCLTDQRQFYIDNYPGLVIEPCGIDELILMLTGGGEV